MATKTKKVYVGFEYPEVLKEVAIARDLDK